MQRMKRVVHLLDARSIAEGTSISTSPTGSLVLMRNVKTGLLGALEFAIRNWVHGV